MTQLQHNVPTATAGNLAANNASRDAQRQAASAQLKQATQRSNYRGYDSTPTQQQRREAAKTQLKTPTPQQQQRREAARATSRTAHLSSSSAGSSSSPPRQPSVSRRSAICAPTPLAATKAAPSSQAQQERGLQSRQLSGVNRELREGARERLSEHHELRRR